MGKLVLIFRSFLCLLLGSYQNLVSSLKFYNLTIYRSKYFLSTIYMYNRKEYDPMVHSSLVKDL